MLCFSLMQNIYDIAIVGAGPGGYVAALKASQLKAKVIIIEKEEVGGTCLLHGCIPTKTLAYSAKLFTQIKEAESLGIESNPRLDYLRIIDRKNHIVKTLIGGIKTLFKARNVELVYGKARLESANDIAVTSANGEITNIKSKYIIIAAGSTPISLPNFAIDGEKILTNSELLEIKELPKSLLIVGAGIIGIEFAAIFSSFGTDVTVVELLPSILPMIDSELSKEVKKILEIKGVKIFTERKLNSLNEFDVEKILVAIGRKPVTDGLGLEKVGIHIEKHGILVNEKLQTNIQNIFAIGDVTGKTQLAHVASHQGITAVNNIMGKADCMDYDVIPNCIFCEPQIATVGLSEIEAKNKGFELLIGKFPFTALGKAHTIANTKGFVKVVADSKTHKLLGVHMIGPQVTDLIAEAALALKLKASLEDIIKTIHAHPTLPEAFAEACAAALKEPIHTLMNTSSR